MAGISGAGVSAGLLSGAARAQYAAMATLRGRILVNGLRSRSGVFELGARIVVIAMYAAIGLALGAGAGAATYFMAAEGQIRFLPILFWAVFFLWQMAPVVLASFQEQFDLGLLLRFPVSFGSYFLLYVIFGLADGSTILGGLCCLGICIGLTLARPELFAWTALTLVVLAAFNILLVRAIFAWIDRWLSQRKTREIVGAVFMLLILSLQLLNPAAHQTSRRQPQSAEDQAQALRREEAKVAPWLKTADRVQEWLPPGLAARALRQKAEGQPELGWASLGVLGLWVLAVGGVLAWRLGAEYRGENLGAAPKRTNAALIRRQPRRRSDGWTVRGSGVMAALMEKEARALLRTLPYLYALGVPVLMVLILGGLFRNGASGASPLPYAFPLCVAYALLGFTQLFYNNLGTEGAGIQLLFLSPTPIRDVLLAKNLFHSLLFAVDALLAALLATLRLGRPDGAMVAATAAWLLFALPCNLAAGNILSLTMPYRVNPGRISRQRGSQANALLSLLVQLGVIAVSAAVFALCRFLQKPLLAVPAFLALAAAAFFVWMRGLGNVDTLANQRREKLIETLMKTG